MSSVKSPGFRNRTPLEMRALEIAARRARAAEVHRLLARFVSALKAAFAPARRRRNVMRHA